MTHLGLGTSAKLTVIWIILQCYYIVDLILDSISIFLTFYCKFCAFRIILFYIAYIFNFFYLRINNPNIHNNIIGISSFQTGYNERFSSASFYFKSKMKEASHKGKNMLFNFWALFLKMYIFEVVAFFSCLVVIQSTQFFSGSAYL